MGMILDDDLGLFDYGSAYHFIFDEGWVGRHAFPPIEFEYLTWSSEGKVLCQTSPLVLGSDLDGLHDALSTEGGVYVQVKPLGQPYVG